MKLPHCPHAWDVTPCAARAIQRDLAARVSERPLRWPPRWIAGADAAFPDDRACVAAVVVWDAAARRIAEIRLARRPLSFPYVPGLLSFREAPAILDALARLRRTPDALMCDGHGRAHPRRFGLACHLGVVTGLPSVGCAKSRLCGTHREPGPRRGGATLLKEAGERIGRVVRTRDRVRPMYVSVGHRCTLEDAVRLTLATAIRGRMPEPTRRADRVVRRMSRRARRAPMPAP